MEIEKDMEKEEKIKRLKSLKNNIEQYSDDESKVFFVQKLLEEEIVNEKESENNKAYLNTLNSIIEYELFKHTTSRRQKAKTRAKNDYSNLIISFKLAVSMQLNQLELSNQ